MAIDLSRHGDSVSKYVKLLLERDRPTPTVIVKGEHRCAVCMAEPIFPLVYEKLNTLKGLNFCPNCGQRLCYISYLHHSSKIESEICAALEKFKEENMSKEISPVSTSAGQPVGSDNYGIYNNRKGAPATTEIEWLERDNKARKLTGLGAPATTETTWIEGVPDENDISFF